MTQSYTSFKSAIANDFDHKLSRHETEHGFYLNDDKTIHAINIKKQSIDNPLIMNAQWFNDDKTIYTVHIHPSHLDKQLHQTQNGMHLYASGIHVDAPVEKTIKLRSKTPYSYIYKTITTTKTLKNQTVYVGFFELNTDHFEVLDGGYIELQYIKK